MKRILIALGFLAALISGAPAQSTKSQLNTEVTTNYPDNTTGAITPSILRSTTNDMIASWQQAPVVNAQSGTTYAIVVGDYGKMVTFNNAGAIAVSIPQATGSFTTFNVFVKNLGAGTVTVTPTTSTINGSSTFSLTTGNSAQIISDGTNYQVWGNIGAGTGSVTSVATGTGLTGGPITSSGTISCVTFTALLNGCVPASGGGSSNFLRSDGSWTTPAGGGTVTSVALALPGIFTVSGSPVTTTGTLTGTLATESSNTIWAGPTTGAAAAPTFRASVLADLPSIANNTVLGNTSGGSAAPSALSAATLTTLCNSFTASLSGCVPSSGGGTSNFLRSDGTWTTPAGGGTVTSVATGAGLSGGPITTTGTITLASGVNSGTQSSQTTSFTVGTGDCGKDFLFSSTSQGTVTAAAASGFASGCKFWITNVGSYTGPSSARGLLLSSISGATFPTQGFVLYPGQKTEFTNISSVWVETGYDWRKRWKPSANFTLFADASNGSDTANDCLGSTTGACATLANTFNRVFNFTDSSGGNAQATMSTTGTFGSGDVIHMAGMLPGGAGNAMLTWNGNGSTNVVGGAQPCLATFQKAAIEVIGITCSTSNACLTATTNSYIGILTTAVTCNLTGTTGVVVSTQDQGTKVEFINAGLNIGAATMQAVFLGNLGGQVVFDGALSISLNGNITVSLDTVFMQWAFINFGGATFALNAHTVTGTRYSCSLYSVIAGTSGAPNTLIPGSVNGSNGADCQTP